jgi:hypothetical protein
MRFVILIAIHAMLFAHLREAFIADIMQRDAVKAEEFWLRSLHGEPQR